MQVVSVCIVVGILSILFLYRIPVSFLVTAMIPLVHINIAPTHAESVHRVCIATALQMYQVVHRGFTLAESIQLMRSLFLSITGMATDTEKIFTSGRPQQMLFLIRSQHLQTQGECIYIQRIAIPITGSPKE